MRAPLPAFLALGLMLLTAAPAAAEHARRAPHRPAAAAAHAEHQRAQAERLRTQRIQAERQALAVRGAAARVQATRSAGRLEAARRQAAADAARATVLSQATVAIASRVQDTERDAAEAAGRSLTLRQQQDQARAALQAAAAGLAPMLPVIERLSLYPSETLLASPASPTDSLAGLMVLRGLGRTLEQKAQALRDAQARFAALGTQLDTEQARLAALQRRQAEQQAQLESRTQAAEAAQRASRLQADQAARAAADAAARAATLGDAVARIEAAERAAQLRFQQEARTAETAATPAIAQQARERAASLALPVGPGLEPGQAPGSAPVAGRIMHGFGDRTDAGAASGVTYAPVSLATVTAPCAGRVDFAGPFRSYGRMLILDCGHDYRFVLAGLDRLDVAVGQSLARGAAIGRMPAWSETPGGGRPSLYVQLRHGDATIDPGRFLQRPR